MGVCEVQLACSDDPIVVGIKKRAKFQFLSILEVKMVGNTLGRRVITHIHLARHVVRDLNIENRTRDNEMASFLSFFQNRKFEISDFQNPGVSTKTDKTSHIWMIYSFSFADL